MPLPQQSDMPPQNTGLAQVVEELIAALLAQARLEIAEVKAQLAPAALRFDGFRVLGF